MQGTSAALLAAITVLALLIIAAYVWYNYTGWAAFSFKTGDAPAWTPAAQADISLLRFKDCVFTVQRGDGVAKSYDVTPALNGMAVAYRGGGANPAALTLTRPLNPFSFVIPGFNDRASVPDPSAAPWCASPPPACTADRQCPLGVRGACSCSAASGQCPASAPPAPGRPAPLISGVCFSCPGGATVTLTGKWRTL